jgi:hypothetical protein
LAGYSQHRLFTTTKDNKPMKTAQIRIAGHSLLGAVDEKGNYYIAVRELEKALEWHADSTRKKTASKSLKAFTGKEIPPVKKRIGASSFNMLLVSDVTLIIGWESGNGNAKAVNLLVSLAQETFERRINDALGIVKTEVEYEERTSKRRQQLEANHRGAYDGNMNSTEADVLHKLYYGVDTREFKQINEAVTNGLWSPNHCTDDMLEELVYLRKRFVNAKAKHLSNPYEHAVEKTRAKYGVRK